MDLDLLVQHIRAQSAQGSRKLVAVAGPPASGKSTLAKDLSTRIPSSRVVPMDGFHLDNDTLTARGLLQRKGAPSTFDAQGFVDMVSHLATHSDVSYPEFSREEDRALKDAGRVDETVQTVIVEGNYLLLDHDIWRDLYPLWDVTIQLSVPLPELHKRLIQRWTEHGFSSEEATQKAQSNDLPNAQTVLENALPAQIILTEPQNI